MNALLFNSDTLLRPDVGLVLPFLAASTRNWPLLMMSTALQPFKWQSGCGCFVKLCLRKRRSIRVAIFMVALIPLLHFGLALPTDDEKLLIVAGCIALGLSFESIDTKALKTVLVGSALLLQPLAAVIVSLFASGIYAHLTGWKIRGKECVDVLATNSLWLVTRDLRLAKRVNNYGDFHLEYEMDGKQVLVGDGRLVGDAGMKLKTGLELRRFVESEGNLDAFDKCVDKGKIIVKGEYVSIVS